MEQIELSIDGVIQSVTHVDPMTWDLDLIVFYVT